MGSDSADDSGRIKPRIFVPGPIEAEIPDAPNFAANSYDLSEGGICLLMPDRVRPGDIVMFALDHTDGKTYSLEAIVCWAKETTGGFRAGLQWQNLKSDERHALEHLLEQLVADGATLVDDPTVDPTA